MMLHVPKLSVLAPMCSITGSVDMPGEASAGAVAKIALNTVVADTHGWWDATNKRYIPKRPGRYLCSAFFAGTQTGTGTSIFWDLLIAKNGAGTTLFNRQPGSTSFGPNMCVAGTIVVNGTTDYLELWGGQSSNTHPAITGSEQLDIFYVAPA